MSNGTFHLCSGSVAGMGREADCELMARRLTIFESRLLPSVLYEDCLILDAPADLPDGDYKVRFSGYRTVATKRHGIWFACGPVHNEIMSLPRFEWLTAAVQVN